MRNSMTQVVKSYLNTISTKNLSFMLKLDNYRVIIIKNPYAL